MTVERIRDNLKMLEQNLGNLNEYSLTFLDIDDIRAKLSVWRWYVSHGYFEKTGPKPEGIASNPPISWLDAQLQGLSVPLHRDIATCIAPVVSSYMATEGAARRIRDRLSMIFGYVTDEDLKKDQEAAHKKHILDPLERKRDTQLMRDHRAREKAKKDHRTPEQLAKLAEDHLKKKNKQRDQFRKEEVEKKKIAQEHYLAEGRRLKNRGNKA